MNRLISTMLDQVTPQSLPPINRQGPARILFLSIHALGWRTFGEQLEDYASRRDDVDAVHIRLCAPTWMRALNRARGIHAGSSLVHPMQTWSWIVGKWLRGSVPLNRFDVVHCSPATSGLALARRRAGAEFKLSVSTDCTEALWVTQLWHDVSPARWKREQELEREIYSACDLVAPWCRWVVPSLQSDYGIHEQKLQICHPALSDADFQSTRVAAPPRANNLVRIVFVALDWRRKGGPELLRWHQAHLADRAELHIVCGKAPVSPEARNVIWHGAVPHAKLLSEILPAMDLFVFPTRIDILPNVLIEAASFGLPAVASRIAGIPELILDGQTGFLCDAGDEIAFIDAIIRLVDDAQLRARMSQAARSLAEKQFTTASQFGPLFDRLVQLADAKTPAGFSVG